MQQFLIEEPNFAQIAGSFNDWKPEAYEKSYLVETEEQKVQFKFIDFEGNWTTSTKFLTCEDDGNLNNFYEFDGEAKIGGANLEEAEQQDLSSKELIPENVQLDKVVALESSPVKVEPLSLKVLEETIKSDQVVLPQPVEKMPIAALETLSLQAAASVLENETPATPPNSPVSALNVQEEALKSQVSENTLSPEAIQAAVEEKKDLAQDLMDDLPLERTHTLDEPKLQKKPSFFKKVIGLIKLRWPKCFQKRSKQFRMDEQI